MTTEDDNDRSYDAADLIGGEDHDFVVNLYLALLGRWPDEEGYRKYRDMVAGRPERRLDALREVAASEEAQRTGTRLVIPAGPAIPPGPNRLLAISLALHTDWLRREMARLQDTIGLLRPAPDSEFILARDAALHFEINALRREMTERLEAMPGLATSDAAATREAAMQSVLAVLERHAAGLVAAAEAKFELRLREMERRLIALESRAGE